MTLDQAYLISLGLELDPVIQAQIVEINQELFNWSPAMSQADFALPYSQYDLIKVGEKVLAFMTSHLIAGEGEIIHVWVDPAWRGQGLGQYLMQKLQGQTKFERLFLEVRASNQPAINLYKRAGFMILGRRKNYYQEPREDAILMNWERRDKDDPHISH